MPVAGDKLRIPKPTGALTFRSFVILNMQVFMLACNKIYKFYATSFSLCNTLFGTQCSMTTSPLLLISRVKVWRSVPVLCVQTRSIPLLWGWH